MFKSNFVTIANPQNSDPDRTEVLGNLPEIVGSFSGLTALNVTENYAELVIQRTIEGINRVFIVNYVRDSNGQWKLDSM